MTNDNNRFLHFSLNLEPATRNSKILMNLRNLILIVSLCDCMYVVICASYFYFTEVCVQNNNINTENRVTKLR